MPSTSLKNAMPKTRSNAGFSPKKRASSSIEPAAGNVAAKTLTSHLHKNLEFKPVPKKSGAASSMFPRETFRPTGNAKYTPAHFRLKPPKLRNFRDDDAKFGYTEVQKKIRADLKQAVRKDCNRMPNPAGEEKNIFLINSPNMDFFRYYVELNEPDVFQRDLIDFAESHEKEADEVFFNISERAKVSVRHRSMKLKKSLRTSIPLKIRTRTVEADEYTYPNWYRGFVGDTWLNFWTTQSANSNGFVEFCDFTDSGRRIFGKIPVIFRGGGEKSRLWIAKRLNGEFEQFLSDDLVLVRPQDDGDFPGLKGYKLGHHFVYHDIFDHIYFRVAKGAQDVDFNRFSVKLNGIVTCKSWEVGGERKAMKPGDTYRGSKSIYKYKQSLLDFPSSPILKIAANELGRAWCSKYEAKWKEIWCSEFATWVFREAGNTIFPNVDHGGRTIRKKFIKRDLFLNSETRYMGRKRSFSQIDELVKPGFWIYIFNGKHTEIFWKWKTIKKDRCSFHVINGNSSSIVKTQSQIVYDEKGKGFKDSRWEPGKRYRTKQMYWKGIVYPQNQQTEQVAIINGKKYFVQDGFGNTVKHLKVRGAMGIK